jgi:hypothetical protein
MTARAALVPISRSAARAVGKVLAVTMQARHPLRLAMHEVERGDRRGCKRRRHADAEHESAGGKF